MIEEIQISNYTDYRAFLRDLYLLRQKKGSSCSYRALARRAGFKSPMSIKNILDGKQNLAMDRIETVAKAFNLPKKDYEYFYNLVQFTHASTEPIAYEFLQKLLSLKQKSIFSCYLEEDRQLKVFSKWYYPVICELSGCRNFKLDANWIYEALEKKISKQQVLQAISDLKEMGFLGDKSADVKQIKTPDQIRSSIIMNYHQQMMKLAERSLQEGNPNEREFGTLTISLTRDQFQIAKNMVREFRHKLQQTLASPDPCDQVIQFNFEVFPVTQVSSHSEDKKEGVSL